MVLGTAKEPGAVPTGKEGEEMVVEEFEYGPLGED